MSLLQIILWVHILCMISVIGVLLCAQIALPSDYRNNASGSIARLANILLSIGFLAGAGYYGMVSGHTMGGHFNGVIGTKFVLLLAAGAVIGISKRSANGDRLRWIALILFVLASFLGISLG